MTVTLKQLAWPLVVFLLLPSLTRAETAVQVWVQRYNGPTSGVDQANAVAVDGSNNVIVTGYSARSGSDYDYLTIKYSSAGAPLWTNRYNGPGNWEDNARAVAVDGSNNVIVTGSSHGGSGGGSAYDYATVKYSSAGLPLWTNRYNGPAQYWDDLARAVTVDGSNNVIVTGNSYDGLSRHDYATIKYSSEGVPLWTNRYNGLGNSDDYAAAVAADGSNNVVVTGYSIGNGSSYDYATIKYSSDGVPLWTNRYNGPLNSGDSAVAVVVDDSNNAIVTGSSWGNGIGQDYATVKYSGAGVPLWTNRYNGPGNSTDRSYAAAVDGSNNVVVTGYSLGSGSFYDYATIKYSSAGVPLWTNRYNGSFNSGDEAFAVVVDGSNDVIVTGYSANTNVSPYNYDYVTIKYSGAGAPLWTNRYNGAGNGDDEACAVALDHSGNAIVTGYSAGSGGDYDFATVKYAFPLMITDVKLTNSTFQMLVDNVQPGPLVIEASADLSATPPDWSPVFTNTIPTNVLFYTDPGTATNPTRFYRAFQFP